MLADLFQIEPGKLNGKTGIAHSSLFLCTGTPTGYQRR